MQVYQTFDPSNEDNTWNVLLVDWLYLNLAMLGYLAVAALAFMGPTYYVYLMVAPPVDSDVRRFFDWEE